MPSRRVSLLAVITRSFQDSTTRSVYVTAPLQGVFILSETEMNKQTELRNYYMSICGVLKGGEMKKGEKNKKRVDKLTLNTKPTMPPASGHLFCQRKLCERGGASNGSWFSVAMGSPT